MLDEKGEQEKENLMLQKRQLEKMMQDMRKKRHQGTDDDRAEDFMEDYYRELLEVERELDRLKNI